MRFLNLVVSHLCPFPQDTSLRMEGLLAWKLLGSLIDVLESPASPSRSVSSRQFTPKTLNTRQGSCHKITRTSYLAASGSSYSRNSEFRGQLTHCVPSTCRMRTKISEESWQSRATLQDPVESVEDCRSVRKHDLKIRVKSTSTFAMLETEIGSCTISNRTSTVGFWITRLSIERTLRVHEFHHRSELSVVASLMPSCSSDGEKKPSVCWRSLEVHRRVVKVKACSCISTWQ